MGKKQLLTLGVVVLLGWAFTACDPNPGDEIVPVSYTISYHSNGAGSGTVPADQTKVQGEDLTLAANSGNLVLADYDFTGWNTLADGNGTHYAAGGTYSADAAATLYAEWTVTVATLAAALDPTQAGSTNYDFSYATGDSASSITGNFTLPLLVSYGTDKTASIVWSEQSDPENNVALSDIGNRKVSVHRPISSDKTVTLRAAISAEGVTASKDIDFTILAATTGIISGSMTWNSLTPGEVQYLAGAVVTAADTTAMAPAAGTDSTDVSGAYSIDAEPGNYYVSINLSGVSFPPSGDPDYRVHIGGVLVSEGGIYTRAGEDCRVDGDNNHLRSLITYSVTTGVTTTVNFAIEGY